MEEEKDEVKSNYQEQCNSIKILNQIFGATYTPANMVYDLLVLHSANLYPSTIINTTKDAKTNNNNYTNNEVSLHHIKIAQPLSALAGIHVNKKGENVYLFTEIKQPLGHTNLTTVEPLKEDSPIKGQCIIYISTIDKP